MTTINRINRIVLVPLIQLLRSISIPALLFISHLLLLSPQHVSADACPGAYSASFICTANDIVVDNVTMTGLPPNCMVGGGFNGSMVIDLGGSTNGRRFETGAYILSRGTNIRDASSQCQLNVAPPTSPFSDLDGDLCGDVDGQGAGGLPIPGWDVGVQDVACDPVPGGVGIQVILDYATTNKHIQCGTDFYVPDGSSKCYYGIHTVPVEALAQLTIRKTANPDDGGDFSFTYTNNSTPTSVTNPSSPFTINTNTTETIYANLSNASGTATISVTETLRDGYLYDSVSCINALDYTTVTPTVTGSTFSVNFDKNMPSIECTVTNYRPPDFGDAPPSYGSPQHTVIGDVYLGTVGPDSEAATSSSSNAGSDGISGDDGSGVDDEESIASFPTLTVGDTEYTIPAGSFNGASGTGRLHAWVDFNKDGSFSADEYATSTLSSGTIDDDLSWSGITAGAAGVTYARFRVTSGILSDDSGTASVDERSTIAAPDGEIEDYQLTIVAPPPPPVPFSCTETGLYNADIYPGVDSYIADVLDLNTGTITFGNIVTLGDTNTVVGYYRPDNVIYMTHAGSIYSVDAAGTALLLGAVSGMPGTITAGDVHPSTGNFWIADGSGNLIEIDTGTSPPTIINTYATGLPAIADFAFDGSGDTAYTAAPGTTNIYTIDFSGISPVFNTTPFSTALGTAGSWDATWVSGSNFYAYASTASKNNETHKFYGVNINTGAALTPITSSVAYVGSDGAGCPVTPPDVYDYSDIPLTGTSYGGASHTIKSNNRLGAAIDDEASDYNDANAAGDGTDDDGITIPALTQSTSATLIASVVGSGGYLQGWIDWNGDGDFADSGEQVAVDLQDGGALDTDGNASNNSISFTVSVPFMVTTNQTFARFRWSKTAGLGSTGAAANGEVEDYAFTMTVPVPPVFNNMSGMVFEDINYGGGAGRSQAISSGAAVEGAIVELYDSAGNLYDSTATAADGSYSFANILNAQYYIRVVNDSVSSTRTGSDGSEFGVQTFRTDGTTATTSEVGGRNPSVADAGAYETGNTLDTSTFIFSAGSLAGQQAQSIQPINLSGSDVTGINFGYNFDTIVNTNSTGQGSLHQFILNSNLLDNTGLDQVDNPSDGAADPAAGVETSIFEIPGAGVHTIAPTTPLPAVTDSHTALDATTQTGSVCAPATRSLQVMLDGSGAGVFENGFSIDAGHGSVRGFSIGNFTANGVDGTANADNLTIACNHIGVATDGTTLMSNTRHGIGIDSTSNTLIGGSADTERNIISGNGGYGINLSGVSAATVRNNYIGTDLNGSASISNSQSGLANGVGINTSALNVDLLNNVISGNTSNAANGIFINAADSVNIRGNMIGTNAAGSSALGNGSNGIDIANATNVTIGGTTSSERNIISANAADGINTRFGTSNLDILGNYIGTDISGNSALGNSRNGLELDQVSSATIGDGSSGGRNIVSNNGFNGIRNADSSGTLVKGNYIGTNAAGTAAMGNRLHGLVVSDSANVEIGGSGAGDRNIIADSGVLGAFASGSSTNARFEGNLIGLLADGSTPAGNYLVGLVTSETNGVVAHNNVISANGDSGVYIVNSPNTTLTANHIGVDETGNTSQGNALYGIEVYTSAANLLIDGNVVSGNTSSGISIHQGTGTDNVITDNLIGLGADGSTAIGNGNDGITLYGVAGVTVGGSAADAPNTVAHNTNAGIRVLGTGAQNNTISRNSTFNNTGLGIDLDDNTVSTDEEGFVTITFDNAVQINDANDADAAFGNLAYNFPQFSLSNINGSNLIIAGCAPTGSTIEIFEADVSPTSTSGAAAGDNQFGLTQDYGEGATYLTTLVEGTGEDTVTTPVDCSTLTDGDGNSAVGMSPFQWTIALPAALQAGDLITATATLAGTGTSEFSPTAILGAGKALSGIIFEDVNYAGGLGRDQATSSGLGVNGVTVELYDNTGAFVDSTTTANDGTNDGAYTFAQVPDGNYYVRVVNDTVSSTRTGSDGTELAVQTFRTDGTTPVTGEVGGRAPATADGGTYDSGSPSTLDTASFTFSGGTLDTTQAQSVTPITMAAADITGIDFGYNFDTIVNTNDSGQGSLGQFILNSNLLTDIPNQGINPGQETSIFMIPDGTGYAGTADHAALDLTTSGVAVIATTAGLPTISDSNTAIDGSTQNGSSCAAPRNLIIQLDGSGTAVSSGINGLDIAGDGALVRAISAGGFDGHGVELRGDDADILCNHLGLNVAGTTVTPNTLRGLFISGSTDVRIGDGTLDNRNILSGNLTEGVFLNNTKSGIVVDTNYMGTTLDGMTELGNGSHGLFAANIDTVGSELTIQNNVSSGNTVSGVYVINSDNLALTVDNNLLGMAMDGTTPLANKGHGLHISGGNTGTSVSTVTNNTLSGNTQNGIWLGNTNNVAITANNIGVDTAGAVAGNDAYGIRILNGTAITIGDGSTAGSNTIANNGSDGVYVDGTTDAVISRNSLYNNTGLGIDLVSTVNDVTVNEANDADTGPNALLNFPQFSQTYINGSNLTLIGCAPTGSIIEVYEADISPSSASGASAGDNQFGMTQDYGEGETYLASFVEGTGEDTVTTPVDCNTLIDADGNDATGMSPFQWTIPLPAGLVQNDVITATATLVSSGTSEFSARSALVGLDYGDAPGYADAAHAIDGVTHLGTAPDVDTGTVTTNGDASDDANDDGVFTDAGLTTSLQGSTMRPDDGYTLHIPVVGSGNLYAWIDWNGDSDFDEANEQIANAIAGNTETLTVAFTVPLGTASGNIYARFRFSSDAAAATPTGTAGNGEVEDYQIVINNDPTPPSSPSLAHCTATWTPNGSGGYQSTTAQGLVVTATASAGANSSWSFAPNDALNTSGTFSESTLNGSASLSTVFFWDTSPEDGRNDQAATDGETGTLTFNFSVPVNDPLLHIDRIGGNGGHSAASPQQLSNSALITPNAVNASATFTRLVGPAHFEATAGSIQRTPNETQVYGEASSQSGTDSTRYTAMGSVEVPGNYSSLALDFAGTGVEGAGADGIEFVLCAHVNDYSDASVSYNDATHIVTPGLGLGPAIDVDTVSMASVDASGDGFDDDGVRLNGTTLQDQQLDSGRAATLAVYAQGAGRLHGWIDWDGDGVFGNNPDELIVSETANASGTRSITVTPPASLTPGISFARFRYSTDATAANPTGAANDGEVEDYRVFLTRGFNISGRVFNDTNVNAASDGAEPGIGGVAVVLYDTVNMSCVSTRTNANGDYLFNDVAPGDYQVYEAAGETVPVPQSCNLANAADPTGYLSTFANNSATFSVSNSDLSGIDFGDIQAPLFELDNEQTILPNSAALHPHVFTAQTDGSVSFSIISETADPAALNWGLQLLLDANCDGQLSSANGDSAMPASINVTAGQQVCILAKVVSPSNASAGAVHVIDIQSDFTYGDGTLGIANDLQIHRDITRSLAGTTTAPPTTPVVDPVGTPDPIAGEGKLSLVKSVWNVTRNIDGNVALPGETLRYIIHYENIGNGPLNELIINDSVPAFTQLVPASMLCTDTPAELPACAANDNNGGLSWGWTVNDNLLPGSSGSVSYEVIVE